MTDGKKVALATLIGILFSLGVYAVSFGISYMIHVQRERVDEKVDEQAVDVIAPIIGMTADELGVPGIEGSYCTAQLCVDKVGPSGLADTIFTPINSDNVVVTLREPAREVTVGLRDSTGKVLKCDMHMHKQDDLTYTATICNDPGDDYYVDVSAWWTEGGDATFYFPVATR